MTKTISSDLALECANLVLHMAKKAEETNANVIRTPAKPFIELAKKIEGKM